MAGSAKRNHNIVELVLCEAMREQNRLGIQGQSSTNDLSKIEVTLGFCTEPLCDHRHLNRHRKPPMPLCHKIAGNTAMIPSRSLCSHKGPRGPLHPPNQDPPT